LTPKSVRGWLKLMSAQNIRVDLILEQNDVMGVGAKKAIEEAVTDLDRDDLRDVPILGVDGVPKTGQAWVRNGQPRATVIVPPISDKALTLMMRALLERTAVSEHIFTAPVPFPEIEKLAALKPH
jgi:ABC-type sugar transport system substrate-binding protein